MSEYIERNQILAQIEAKQKSLDAAVNCYYREALSDVYKIVADIPAANEAKTPAETHNNYDRIRNRTIDEVAEYIYSRDEILLDEICKSAHDECPFGDNIEPSNCINCIKRWLESEVDTE